MTDLAELITLFTGAAAVSLTIGSPVEWLIHRYLLHPKKSEIVPYVNDNTKRGHTDIHHRGYAAPWNYYQNATNEHVVLHFAKNDVALIHAIAIGVGVGLDRIYAAYAGTSGVGPVDAAIVLGTLAGSALYYGLYESAHHVMHVSGKQRLGINRVLGDRIQYGAAYVPGQPRRLMSEDDSSRIDEKLRFSKPLLDDICAEVQANIERNIDAKDQHYTFSDGVVARLKEQLAINRASSRKPLVAIAEGTEHELLESVTTEMLQRERESRASLRWYQKPFSWLKRTGERVLRWLPPFKYLDNHHFLHHIGMYLNLNVVFPLMDFVMGTKADSSVAQLEAIPGYWLCPNSVEAEKFEIPPAVQRPGLLRLIGIGKRSNAA
ncbi:hypothetical protein HY493_03025 [Candidatus Woesearchaeota archaeon]|nr:hypothetical protein [Candidatus Woesearchaeota archaeon]